MMFAHVVLKSLSLTGREVTEVARIAETFVSRLLVPPQISCNGELKSNDFCQIQWTPLPGKL